MLTNKNIQQNIKQNIKQNHLNIAQQLYEANEIIH